MAERTSGTSPPRQRWAWVVLALLLTALGGAALAWSMRPIEVPLATVSTRDVVETLLTTGRVVARGTRDLASEHPGRVLHIHRDEGETFAAGDVLAALDCDDPRLQLEARAASLRDADARLQRLRGTTRSLAGVALEQARMEEERATREVERAQALVERGLATSQSLDAARDAQRAATLATRRSEAELRALGREGVDVLAALAQVDLARTEHARAELRVDACSVRAPMAGRVLGRHVELGVMVAAGQALLTLAPDEGLEIRLQPDERELARVEPGQRVWVGAPSLEGPPLEGRVARVLPAVDPQRGVMDARVTFEDLTPVARAALRPHLTVDVEIELATWPGQRVVPRSALVDEGAAAFVTRIASDRVERVPVTVRWRGDEDVAIEGPLRSGDPVIAVATDPRGLPLANGRRVRAAAVP